VTDDIIHICAHLLKRPMQLETKLWQTLLIRQSCCTVNGLGKVRDAALDFRVLCDATLDFRVLHHSDG